MGNKEQINQIPVAIGRLPWVDVAKGILIFFVVVGHVQFYANEFAGSHAFDFFHHFLFLFLPYYIIGFFVVTGFCSNFDIPFKDFLVKNVKTLLVPSILIGSFVSKWIGLFLYGEGISIHNFIQVNYVELLSTGGHWFLTTLFLAKMAIWVQRKNIKKHSWGVFTVLLIMMLMGTILYNREILPNIWYFKHTLLLLPFLYIGTVLRNHPDWIDRPWILPTGGGTLLLALLLPRLGIPYPYIMGAPGVFWGNFWLCIIMGTCGSLMIFSIAKSLSWCKPLEIMGRHSLMIFLLHSVFLVFFLRLSVEMGIESNQAILILGIVSILILALSILFPIIIDLWIDKHARFLKGKF